MSKKHLEAMAAEIRNCRRFAYSQSDDSVRLAYLQRAEGAETLFISVAMQFNPRFDAARFRAACQN
jgi:hypothetical protein